MVTCDREPPGKLTLWLRGTGDRKSQGIDAESPDHEEDESRFGEHDGVECRVGERITMAPGLKFGR